jgi:hypothetical protein
MRLAAFLVAGILGTSSSVGAFQCHTPDATTVAGSIYALCMIPTAIVGFENWERPDPDEQWDEFVARRTTALDCLDAMILNVKEEPSGRWKTVVSSFEVSVKELRKGELNRSAPSRGGNSAPPAVFDVNAPHDAASRHAVRAIDEIIAVVGGLNASAISDESSRFCLTQAGKNLDYGCTIEAKAGRGSVPSLREAICHLRSSVHSLEKRSSRQ